MAVTFFDMVVLLKEDSLKCHFELVRLLGMKLTSREIYIISFQVIMNHIGAKNYRNAEYSFYHSCDFVSLIKHDPDVAQYIKKNYSNVSFFTLPENILGKDHLLAWLMSMFGYSSSNAYRFYIKFGYASDFSAVLFNQLVLVNGNSVDAFNRMVSILEGYMEIDRSISWVEDSGAEAFKYFGNWFLNKYPQMVDGVPQIEDYLQLVNFIYPKFKDFFQLRVAMEKLKKAWYQKNYREKMADKSQCNFFISNDSSRKLKSLSMSYKLSQAEIIDILIQFEYEYKAYIKERLIRSNKDQILSIIKNK